MLPLRHHILPVLFALAFGVVVGAYVRYAVMLAFVLGLVALCFLARVRKGVYPLTSVLAIALIVGTLGMLRGAYVRAQLEQTRSILSIGKFVELSGVVQNEPEVREDGQRFAFALDESGSGNVLVTAPHYPLLHYGDHIAVGGVLHEPEDFTTGTGGYFRYEDLLRARGTVALMRSGRVRLIGPNEGNAVVRMLLFTKAKIKEVCDRLPTPENGLLMGMIFGGKNGLPAAVQDDFKVAGLIHIIVLSGENLTIIALIITFFVRKLLGFLSGVIVSGIIVCAYAIIGGMEPATMRALVVVLLLFCAILLRREARLPRMLFIGGSLLLAYDPFLLFDDSSFQLSMLAILGLLYIGPYIERVLLLRGVPLGISLYLAPILGAQLGVLPFIMWSSQAFTSYALFANIAVLFFIGFLSVGGIIIVAVGTLIPQIFSIIALPVQFALSAVLLIAHAIARLPAAYIPISVSGWWVALIYAFMVVALFRYSRSSVMTPLARFTLREEVKQLAKRKIPWSPPLPEVHGIRFDHDDFTFSRQVSREKHEETERIIDWGA